MAEEPQKQTEEEDDTPTAPAWMATFSDMMTLLMCFFILIMSFSTLELDKFKMAMGSLKGAFGVLGVQKMLRPEQSWFSPSAQSVYSMKQKSVLEHMEKLRSVVDNNKLNDKVDVFMSEGQVFVEIRDSMLFEPGNASVKPSFAKFLSIIARTVLRDAKQIVVEGYTDDTPIHTEKYPSNWELSTDRAVQVVKYFVDQENVPPSKLSAAGYGEFRPLQPNTSAENRAANRRVLLKIEI